MKSFAYLLPLVLVFVIVGLSAYVRLAPSTPALWHIDPTDPVLQDGSGSALIRSDAALQSPDFAQTPLALLERLDAIARATPRTRVLAGSPSEGRITYITRSKLMAFPDYTTVVARPTADGAQLVAYARQRFGQYDMGVNAARLEDWLDQLSR